jgi:predicted O-methyltransferase YrrM
MNAIISKLVETGLVEDVHGQSHNAMQIGISIVMAQILHTAITERNVLRSIEIGCAYGVSSMYICDALAQRPGAVHVIIDPAQSSRFQRIGVGNLERCGYDFFRLIEEPSELALPRLWQAGERFDFALIRWQAYDRPGYG